MVRRAWFVGVAAAAVAVGTGEARGEERIALRVEGACPGEEAVARALPALVRVVEAGDGVAVIEIEAGEGGAMVRLRTPGGAAPAETWLEGRDCDVLAAAVAAIADAWFVELDVAPTTRAVATAPAPAPAEDDEWPTVPEEEAGNEGGARARPSRWSIAVARAIAVDGALAAAAPSFHFDVSWAATRGRRLRARLDWGERTELPGVESDTMSGVERKAWAAVVAVGQRWTRDRAWGEVAGGPALVMSQVRPTTLPDAVEPLRVHAALAATAAAGVRVGSGVSVRLEVGALAFAVRDRYTRPPETLARSPRSTLTAALGLEIVLGARSW